MSDPTKPVVVIDGEEFSTLEEFAALLLPFFKTQGLYPEDWNWEGNFDFLDEILGGWYNDAEVGSSWSPPGEPTGFVLRWKNSSLSRERLGYPATVEFWQGHVSNALDTEQAAQLRESLHLAQLGQGKTIFDHLTEIIRDHGSVGSEPVDGVELLLE